MNIYTTKGVIDTDLLTIKDVVTLEPTARVTATEWYLGDELVRRDVNVNILVSQSLGGEQGNING